MQQGWVNVPGCVRANHVRDFWQFAADNDLVVAPHSPILMQTPFHRH
jgi:hypothetical protein